MRQCSFLKFCLWLCIIALAIAALYLVLTAAVDLLFIESIEIYSSDTVRQRSATLTFQESTKLMFLYHTAPYAGSIALEAGNDDYGVLIRYRMGTEIELIDGTDGHMIVIQHFFGAPSANYYNIYKIKSPELLSYIRDLITQYELPENYIN